jgi:hypothetical protein
MNYNDPATPVGRLLAVMLIALVAMMFTLFLAAYSGGPLGPF